MEGLVGSIWWVRLTLQRGLAAIYLLAFISVVDQFRPLLGERGLLPVRDFLRRVSFLDAPSLFHLHYQDRYLMAVAVAGAGLSIVALAGWSESGPLWVSISVWLALYALYLSIVNVGQDPSIVRTLFMVRRVRRNSFWPHSTASAIPATERCFLCSPSRYWVCSMGRVARARWVCSAALISASDEPRGSGTRCCHRMWPPRRSTPPLS